MEEKEEFVLPEEENPLASQINCCPNIKLNLSGVITELGSNLAKSRFVITSDMLVDEEGLANSGFVFNAATYVAQAVLNVNNTMVMSSKVAFFAPAKLGDVIEFEASSKLSNLKKREVKVVGTLREIKIFEGMFQVVASDEHILKINEEEIEKQEKARKKEAKLKRASA